MELKIIVETPLLPDLIEAYLENDALELERSLNNEDVLVDATLEVKSLRDNNQDGLAAPITELLNEYLTLYSPSDENEYFEDGDELGSLIHDIVSTIVELIPGVSKIEMMTDRPTSLLIYSGESE